MTEEKLERILSKVAPERREVLRQMLLAPVWVPPLISSFSMAVLGLRLSSRVNGVSKLHATVSRRPATSATGNGVVGASQWV